MRGPVSVRLDDDMRHELMVEARQRGIGVATLMRELVSDALREARRVRIREESAAVARYVRSEPEAQEFYRDWGTPLSHVGK